MGETPEVACVRETKEECGLDVVVEREAGQVVRPGGDELTKYHITDFICSVRGGALTAGDDAADARWVAVDDLGAFPLTAGLLEALATWGVI